ncbi:hypothetical protein BCEN4_50065 [Burkholderia cenocepacia]|nr:hypothetical protein BCEN4_50065 [Burkholderia cenocepacia]
MGETSAPIAHTQVVGFSEQIGKRVQSAEPSADEALEAVLGAARFRSGAASLVDDRKGRSRRGQVLNRIGA